MATTDKHRARSHRTNYKKRMNKAWFYNHRGYQIWVAAQRKLASIVPETPPVEEVTPEIVE